MNRLPSSCLLLVTCLALPLFAQDEGTYYRYDSLTPPEGEVLEIGGMGFLPNGRMVVSTRRGQVWSIENALAEDPRDARFTLIAEGLHDCLGLEVVGDDVWVVQRAELSRLRDVDGDGVIDDIDTVCNDWGVSGNYHEFAFGLPRDDAGNFYVSLNVSFFSPKWWHGKSPVPYRGWVVKIAPDGTMTPFAPGFRSPCGIGRNAAGDIFVTDNQGDWMPTCPIYHVVEGRFYGHPASLDWTPEYQAAGRKSTDTDPPAVKRAPAAAWLPYGWSRSTGNLVADGTKGRFSPFADQLFVSEMTNGILLRAQLEKVRGEYQGAVFVFRREVGSATRLAFAPDGTLFVGRTNRGWGGQSPSDGIGRLRPTGVKPFEMQSVHLVPQGFDITFTEALADGAAPRPEDLELIHYDYDYWWEYGSPEFRTRHLAIASVDLSADRRVLRVAIPELRAGKVARMRLPGLRGRSGAPLLHDEFAYTINQLADGPEFHDHVAKLVPPPRPKEKSSEGWVYLMNRDAAEDWRGDGWHVGPVALAEDRRSFVAEEPADDGARERGATEPTFTNLTEETIDLTSRFEAGPIEVGVDFRLAEGGRGSLWLGGRYEVRIGGVRRDEALTPNAVGGLAPGSGFPGRAPQYHAFKDWGESHHLAVRYVPPVFEDGVKVLNARILRVMLDDVLLHVNVELPGPSDGAPLPGETETGPLVLRATGGVAYQRLALRVINVPVDNAGWERIFNGVDLKGWKVSDGGSWKVENGEIVGSGPRSHLFSPRGDYRNFELRANLQISHDGNSGMYVRCAFGPGWPAGYEAQVNADYANDPVRSGSLYGLETTKSTLVGADTWFTQHVICRDTDEGVHLTIKINDVVISDFVDRERKFTSGHAAFQQHHEGSVVRFRDIEIRELD